MTDPLDDLRSALDRATPAPDAAKKADILARAQENFDRAQGLADATRPTRDRPSYRAAFMTGVGRMLSALTARPALTATTAIVAVGLVVLVPVLRDGPPGLPDLVQTEVEEDAPEVRLGLDDERSRDLDMAEPEIAMEAPVVVDQVAGGQREQVAPTLQAAAPTSNAAKVAREGAADAVGMIAPSPYPEPPRAVEADTEAFANAPANPVIVTADEPVSTFSVDVDTASYAVVRSSLMGGRMPPPDAVRIEEMVNYFPYAYPAPDADEAPFRPTVSIGATPWNPETQLLHIGLQGRMPALDDRPPLNLVFLIDTSGSMDDPAKLPLLKQSFRLMLGQLRPEDQVAIVTYAGSAGRVLDATPASDRATILGALNRLDAGGSTAGQAGLQLAYTTAEAMTEDGEVTRVILATDGDFNVGLSDPDALKDYISDKREQGTYLSVLGFGRGNLDDATMQALAQNGNGQAAYIDTLSEAQKVLVDQLTGALFPIANDVKIQVEFNPAQVAEYRLVGYETRALRREDFNNDRIDAGEIGAGHTVTAIYEITPVGSAAVLNEPLRYSAGAESTSQGVEAELAFLRLRYKEPGEDASRLIEMPITPDMDGVTDDTRFAAAIAGFGQLLKGSGYTGEWGYADALALAEDSNGTDSFGYRREAITLMRLARSLGQ